VTTADEGAAATATVTAGDPWAEGAKIAACSDTTARDDAITLSMSFMAVATCLLWFISPCFITSLVFSVLLLSKTVEGGFVSPSETALFDASEESTELLEELNLALSMAEVELEVEVPPPPATPAAPDEGTGFELRSPPGSSSSARWWW